MNVTTDFTALNSALDALTAHVAIIKTKLTSSDMLTWRNAVADVPNLRTYVDAASAAAYTCITITP